MALYSPAIKRLIPPGPNDPRITARVLILHIAVSESASLYDWFNGRSGGVESHFYIRRDGTVEQYRDTAFEADANTDANRFAISIETQGMEHGEWTPEQVAAIKALIDWCHDVHDIPKTVPKSWDGSGVGFHTQFPGRWDKRGASCPGPDRKRQYWDDIVPWLASSEVRPGGAQSMPRPQRPSLPPQEEQAPKAPKFPLQRGHWFGVESTDRRNHSGYYAKDRPGIKAWQAQMRKRGWTIGVDGLFGKQSEKVARQFQAEKRELASDGLVGKETWAAAWTAPVT